MQHDHTARDSARNEVSEGHPDIVSITLDESRVRLHTPEVAHERAAALRDLAHSNRFSPTSGLSAPFHLHLFLHEQRIHLQLRSDESDKEELITAPLSPLRGVIKDYFLVCESYFAAIPHASADRVQTLDMARRGVHNEAATLLTGLLAAKVAMDFETARRLFTLVCVLHLK